MIDITKIVLVFVLVVQLTKCRPTSQESQRISGLLDLNDFFHLGDGMDVESDLDKTKRILPQADHLDDEISNEKRLDVDDVIDWGKEVGKDIKSGAKTALNKTKSGLSKAGNAIGDAFKSIFGK